MAKINYIIGLSVFEKIRDAIAATLEIEFSNQQTLCNAHDPVIPFDKPSIFTERYVPVDQQEGSVIIVRAANGEYDEFTQRDQLGKYTYFIDCYAYSQQTEDDEQYYLSTQKLHRLLMISREILSNPAYNTLGIATPNSGIRGYPKIKSVLIGTKDTTQDSLAETYGRLIVELDIEEQIQSVLGVPLELSSVIQINTEDGKGFLFTVNLD